MKKPKNKQSRSSSNINPSSEPSRKKVNIHTEGGRKYINPIDYDHPWPSMHEFAKLLSLRYDANRTRYSYYRAIRLIHDYFDCDPATLCEAQVRDYFLYAKFEKEWKSKTLRQSVVAAKLFFTELHDHEDWKVFSQIKTKDHYELPAVLTREQVRNLLVHVRLRRYRIPLKLIYCCGLRLGECLSLTVHDILGDENKLWVRKGKNHRDRMVPLPSLMVEDLRKYWNTHRNPLLLFPHTGRGYQTPEKVSERMRQATSPMPYCSLQRLMLVARKELDLPHASVHTLRHCYATHLLEGGASLHTIQALLGHKQINSTMVYLHLTHQSEQDALQLVDDLCQDLPR